MIYIYRNDMLISIFNEYEQYSNWLWQLNDKELNDYQIVYVEEN